MAALLGLGMIGIGVVSPLLRLLGGSLLLLVIVPDAPAIGGSPVTLRMLASQVGVCIVGGGK